MGLVTQGHDQSSTLSQHAAELTLPKHNPLHRDLLRYAKLMEWLKNTQREMYEGLSRVRGIMKRFKKKDVATSFLMHLIIKDVSLVFQTYVDYMSRLYEREIKEFFEVAKNKMAGTTKEAKGKFGKTCSSCNMFAFCSS